MNKFVSLGKNLKEREKIKFKKLELFYAVDPLFVPRRY
jgi:hypothetical protein